MVNAKLPVDISKFKKLSFDAANNKLSAEQKADLQHNIDIFRDAIVAFTTTGAARGVAGHTGGPFDTAVSPLWPITSSRHDLSMRTLSVY